MNDLNAPPAAWPTPGLDQAADTLHPLDLRTIDRETTEAQEAARRRAGIVRTGLMILGALVLGLVIGAAVTPATAGSAPEACAEALDLSEDSLSEAGASFGVIADAMTTGRWGPAADDLESSRLRLESNRDAYEPLADECRGAVTDG